MTSQVKVAMKLSVRYFSEDFAYVKLFRFVFSPDLYVCSSQDFLKVGEKVLINFSATTENVSRLFFFWKTLTNSSRMVADVEAKRKNFWEPKSAKQEAKLFSNVNLGTFSGSSIQVLSLTFYDLKFGLFVLRSYFHI